MNNLTLKMISVELTKMFHNLLLLSNNAKPTLGKSSFCAKL